MLEMTQSPSARRCTKLLFETFLYIYRVLYSQYLFHKISRSTLKGCVWDYVCYRETVENITQNNDAPKHNPQSERSENKNYKRKTCSVWQIRIDWLHIYVKNLTKIILNGCFMCVCVCVCKYRLYASPINNTSLRHTHTPRAHSRARTKVGVVLGSANIHLSRARVFSIRVIQKKIKFLLYTLSGTYM